MDDTTLKHADRAETRAEVEKELAEAFTALKHADRAEIRAAAEKELAEALKAAIRKLNICLAYEDDHIMQHALVSLRGECEWCVKEFCR